MVTPTQLAELHAAFDQINTIAATPGSGQLELRAREIQALFNLNSTNLTTLIATMSSKAALTPERLGAMNAIAELLQRYFIDTGE